MMKPIFTLQDGFDRIAKAYREPLGTHQQQGLDEALKHVDTEIFLKTLYENIVLRIAPEDDSNTDNRNHP